MIDTIYEWENQIVNSFIISDELGGNITNGIVEAKNNVAKTIIKSSYGKNDFKKFRKNMYSSLRISVSRRLRGEVFYRRNFENSGRNRLGIRIQI